MIATTDSHYVSHVCLPITDTAITLDMDLEQRFLEAAEQVKTLTKRPTDEELLELYALFKQGSLGDNTTDKPGMFDLKGKYKWEFWTKKAGMSKEDAQEEYIKFVQTLLEKYA